MTPNEAAAALIGALPKAVSPSNLEEYGIDATMERAQQISCELLCLNLFWISAAVEAHIPKKYQQLVRELVLQAVGSWWTTTPPLGPITWESFLAEWEDRARRYDQVLQQSGNTLAIHTEATAYLEEQRIVSEDERGKLLTFFVDSVPVDLYGQVLQDI
ncbi:MAG TPA: hypothetical protein PKA61_00610 [Nitrospira sp.]|nr:hypothetical protein [Nitrospira sp.]